MANSTLPTRDDTFPQSDGPARPDESEVREAQDPRPFIDTSAIDRSASLDVLDESDIVNPAARQANRDPITGTKGAHPLGVGVGAAAAGAIGGVIGSAVPVVGTAVGVAVGAFIGGLAGKGAAEGFFPTEEEDYWREQHAQEANANPPRDFDHDYLAAYRFGYINSFAYGMLPFEQVEDQLRIEWDRARGPSSLEWVDARRAAIGAWNRARAKQSQTQDQHLDRPERAE